MAETTQRTLPAQFIEDLGRDYGTQIAALTSLPVDTTKFAPQVAAQDALQTAAYTQATDAATGLGSFQPFLTKAGTAADAATGLTGPMPTAQTTAYMSQQRQCNRLSRSQLIALSVPLLSQVTESAPQARLKFINCTLRREIFDLEVGVL